MIDSNTEIDFTQYVPQVKFELIPIKNLVSNQDYQRNVSLKHVQKAAKNFDLCQINPVKVSRRNGVNFVFNGQHTIEIIALVSGSRDTPVWCMIYDELEYTQEADIFANQMKYTKPLAAYEIFMANIEAGNDAQILIKTLVEDYGLFVSSRPQPGAICAIATLEHLHEKYGLALLERTLGLIIGTWEGIPQSFSANMLNGVARLVNSYGNELKDELFKEKLSRVSCKEISRTAKDRRNGSLGYSEAMLIIYNKKTQKDALQFNKLYTNKRRKNADTLNDDIEDESIEDNSKDLDQTKQMDLFSVQENQEE